MLKFDMMGDIDGYGSEVCAAQSEWSTALVKPQESGYSGIYKV